MDDKTLEDFRKSLRVLEREIFGLLKTETVCCGVSVAQCHALLVIEEEGRATVSHLAWLLSLDKSTLSRTVDGLVNSGLLRRLENPENRRYTLLELTEQGKNSLGAIHKQCNDDFRKLFSYLPEEKHQQVLESIALLSQAFLTKKGYQSCCG